MLIRIKERATGWIAWAIVILITIPFALWGINTYFEGVTSVAVAEFDGEEIDYETYQRALYNERDRLRQVHGQNAAMLSSSIVGRDVIDGLVSEILLRRDAQEQGYRVSDEQLVETIRNHPAFQTDNQFNREQYERTLRASGLSIGEFEEFQRQSAVVQQIQTGFRESTFAIESEVDDILNILLEERIGDYALVDSAAFASSVEVTDADIRDEYETNKAVYVEDERIKVKYVQLSLADFAANFVPSEDTLRQLYEAEEERYRNREQRNVSHILLEGEDAEVRAAELVSRLNSGENFGTLAAQYSDDPGSADSGGELGWFSYGDMGTPEFEDVAFNLAAGEISNPVTSSAGTHIILVNEIQSGTIKPFEEVKDDLIAQASEEQAKAEMFEVSEQLRNMAYEEPENLEYSANALNLVVHTSDWFSRNHGTGIADNARVRDAAFGEEVFEQGFNSDLIDIDDENQIVLRILEHEEQQQLSVDEVRSEIHERLLITKSRERAQELADSLVDQLEGGAEWHSVLAQNNLQSSELPVQPDAEGDTFSRSELIAYHVRLARKPDAGMQTFSSASLGDGSIMLFRITEVRSGDVSSAPPESREAITAALQSRFGDGMFGSYLVLLRDGINVNINEDLLSGEPIDYGAY